MSQDNEVKQCAEHQAEQVALGQWLSKYPDDMSYEDILQALRTDEIPTDDKDNDLIVVWQVAEDYSGTHVAGFIEETYYQTLRAIEHVINEMF